MEIEEENCRTVKEKVNCLAFYHFNFSDNNCFFDISKLRSLFQTNIGPDLFREPTKQSFKEEVE